MRFSRLLPALGLAGLLLSGCDKVQAAFDTRVHDYIVSHPEVIQEAMTRLQAKQDADAAAQAKGAINQYRQALERDPRDFVANPDGKITLTEFYDYRCPHCITAAPAVLSIIHDNPNVRVVFKEFPIFGAVSEKAAAGAIALKKAGGDDVSLYRDFMAAHPLDEAAIDRILLAHGVNPDTLDRSPLKDEAQSQMAAVRQLAINLGIQGTPAFIVGDTLIAGDDEDALKAAIKAQRG